MNKILISAFACAPGRGSEPGVGWNVAWEASSHLDVWVITRGVSKAEIETFIEHHPRSSIHFVYHEFPGHQVIDRGIVGGQLYYYLWQISAYFLAKSLHKRVGFVLAHHVTYAKYWGPSFLALLKVPLIWGPVGGGDSAPKAYWRSLGYRGLLYEVARGLARRLGELDPFVRITARRSSLALAATPETALRVARLRKGGVLVYPQIGLNEEELRKLRHNQRETRAQSTFVCVGRLLAFKGIHLAIRALATAKVPADVELHIFGEGPDYHRLSKLAERLGVGERVAFHGWTPRDRVLAAIASATALLHPCLHESGGYVCMEAIAAGTPVICLDLGGPAMQVEVRNGFRVASRSPDETVHALGELMADLSVGNAAHLTAGLRPEVSDSYVWTNRGEYFRRIYASVTETEEPLA